MSMNASRMMYNEKFGSIVQERIFILSDIDQKFTKKAMEKVFENDDGLAIQKLVFNADFPKKSI